MKHYSKRLLCLILAVVLVLSFTACSKKPVEPEAEPGITDSYPFYNPLTEPSTIADAATPVEPDKAVVDKIKEHATKNKDTVGWLRIPGTTIDDVVLQSTDNKYYMRRDNMGKYAFEGCYFADYRNTVKNRSTLGKNTIVYGHNLNDDKKDGVRFAQLMKYTDLDFAAESPYLYLSTAEDDMVFKVFAAFYSDVSFDYIKTKFDDATSFTTLVNEAKLRSEHTFDVSVSATDKILTLSTCTYKFGGTANKDQRFVVMGRLLRTGEKDTDPVTVVKNPSPKAPSFK